jgi:ABC-type multidrug transport system fused ATPase/permease subunit
MIEYILKAWYILKGARRYVPLILVTFLLSSLAEALGVGIIGPFLGLALNPEYLHKAPFLEWTYIKLGFQTYNQFIAILSLIIAVLFFVKSVFYFFAQLSIIIFSAIQRGYLIEKLLHTYLTISYTFHLRRNTSSIIKNIIIESQNFGVSFLVPSLQFIANLSISIFLLFVLALTNLVFLQMILILLLPIFFVLYQFKNILVKSGRESSEAYQGMIKVINHSIGGIKETRIIGCEPYFLNQISNESEIGLRAFTIFQAIQLLPRMTVENLIILSIMVYISISQLFLNQSLEGVISSMAVFAVASMRLIPSISQLISSIGQLQNSFHSVETLYSDLKEIENKEQSKSLEWLPKPIRFSSLLGLDRRKLNVKLNNPYYFYESKVNEDFSIPFVDQVELNDLTYCYPGVSEPSLKELSLSLKKGQSIALIGKSGAGKTTLVDVVLGLLNPEIGDIKVDGISIYKNIRSWQNIVGYIPQSIFLMDDTIERNIAFGIPDELIDGERLNQAIVSAQLVELIEKLPHGLKTEVGERGVRLSGGQRQRLGIARALYHQREILVLDEATSALDNETEKLVSESIQALAGTKTLIVIAHRLTTVKYCDCVYLMDKGRIINSGTYEEVVGKQS